MAEPAQSLVSRIALALGCAWRTLADPAFAAALGRLQAEGRGSLGGAPGSARLKESEPGAALQLLRLLQQEGRFVDFLEEDVRAYSDQEIGAAARVVHEGCRRTVRSHFAIEAVRGESEGTRVTVPAGFDAAAIRLSGKVVGEPPFSGTLVHKGWRASRTTLPKVAPGHDLSILAPAEVEL